MRTQDGGGGSGLNLHKCANELDSVNWRKMFSLISSLYPSLYDSSAERVKTPRLNFSHN